MSAGWLNKISRNDENQRFTSIYESVVDGLQELYKLHLKSLEVDYKHNFFFSPLLTDGDFSARPMVMVLGQYSTGKTTFIRHLLEKDYPGQRVGPEPTTDKFVGICSCDTGHNQVTGERVVPGNAAVVDSSMPWSQLVEFGSFFLSRFECAMMDSPILRGITLIDTPGVLSGNKQADRGYDFEGVVKWFAERVDLILLMFDSHKLDLSDEFRRCINALSGSESKIRIMLNKADTISPQQLLRIYGALMWSLGKVIPSPEVARVYIGSFWDKPLVSEENRKLFEAESNDLYADIARLPRNSAVRKLNDFVKRARHVRAHSLLMNHLRKNLPYFGRTAKSKSMIASLETIIGTVSRESNVPIGDFPSVEVLRKRLPEVDFSKFPKLDKQRIENMNKMLELAIPRLMMLLPQEEASADRIGLEGTVVGRSMASPFGVESQLPPWADLKYLQTPPECEKFASDFAESSGGAESLNGEQARQDLLKSNLPSSVLHRIWNLADVTQDGFLDLYEYSLARHFIQMKLDGFELPAVLPPALLPPELRASKIRDTHPIAVGLTNSPTTGRLSSTMTPPPRHQIMVSATSLTGSTGELDNRRSSAGIGQLSSTSGSPPPLVGMMMSSTNAVAGGRSQWSSHQQSKGRRVGGLSTSSTTTTMQEVFGMGDDEGP